MRAILARENDRAKSVNRSRRRRENADRAMTKPEMTKKRSTPTPPIRNQTNGPEVGKPVQLKWAMTWNTTTESAANPRRISISGKLITGRSWAPPQTDPDTARADPGLAGR